MIDVKDIDALLPQTQCGECGYAGCLPYAQALAQKNATIDLCPPGGVATVKALGELLHIDPTPYEPSIIARTRLPSVAVIKEEECIGCTKCISACPVDAIIGSAKQMHSILTQECTGCGLCVEPCPVDCIEMVAEPKAQYNPKLAKVRYHARQVRLLRQTHEQQQMYREKRRIKQDGEDKSLKQDYILQALHRVQAKKNEASTKK